MMVGGGRSAGSGIGTAAEISSSVRGADWTGRLNPAITTAIAVVARQSSNRILRVTIVKLRTWSCIVSGLKLNLGRRIFCRRRPPRGSTSDITWNFTDHPEPLHVFVIKSYHFCRNCHPDATQPRAPRSGTVAVAGLLVIGSTGLQMVMNIGCRNENFTAALPPVAITDLRTWPPCCKGVPRCFASIARVGSSSAWDVRQLACRVARYSNVACSLRRLADRPARRRGAQQRGEPRLAPTRRYWSARCTARQ